MNRLMTIALVTGAVALSVGPVALAAGKPEGVPPASPPEQTGNPTGQGNGANNGPVEPTPGPKAGLPEKAKAYGRYCKGESHQQVSGESGTPFSRCVTALARAATHQNMGASQACKGESRKHVKGEKGTAFSRCVKAVAKLRRHEAQQQTETQPEGA